MSGNIISSSSTNRHPDKRLNAWFNYYQPLLHHFGAEYLVSGSVSEINNEGWEVPVVFHKGDNLDSIKLVKDVLNVITWEKVYERPTLWTIPAFWRSWHAAAVLAKNMDCDKMIYFESDAFVLTKKLADLIKNAQSGIWMPWCNMYNMPATQIVSVCRDSIGPLIKSIEELSWDQWSEKNSMDHIIEFYLGRKLGINTIAGVIGDNYGETFNGAPNCPENADYYAQATPGYKPEFRMT